MYTVNRPGVPSPEHPETLRKILLCFSRLGAASVSFSFLLSTEGGRPLPLSGRRPRLHPPPRWVLAPAALRVSGAPSALSTPAEAAEPAKTQPGRPGSRGGLGQRAPTRLEAPPQLHVCCRADGLDRARASRAGRAVSGLGRAAGPAGPRTRPVPAGPRCGCLGSADATAGLAPRRPWGPRVRHVPGFCLGGEGLLAKSFAAARPPPRPSFCPPLPRS